jgi:hypothetical protein
MQPTVWYMDVSINTVIFSWYTIGTHHGSLVKPVILWDLIIGDIDGLIYIIVFEYLNNKVNQFIWFSGDFIYSNRGKHDETNNDEAFIVFYVVLMIDYFGLYWLNKSHDGFL